MENKSQTDLTNSIKDSRFFRDSAENRVQSYKFIRFNNSLLWDDALLSEIKIIPHYVL